MKIVLDTNVIISAFLWSGKTSEILDLIKNKEFFVYSCLEQIIELKGVLDRPKFRSIFNQTGLEAEDIVKAFYGLANLVEPVERIRVVKEDETDNIILSCALAAKAEYIITGDKHLLFLKKFQGIKIIKPQQFLKDCFANARNDMIN